MLNTSIVALAIGSPINPSAFPVPHCLSWMCNGARHLKGNVKKEKKKK